MYQTSKVFNIISFIIGGFFKSLGIVGGSFYIFNITSLLFQYFKLYILNLPDQAYVFTNWVGCCIVGMISVILYFIDSLVTLCRIKKSKNLIIDIINISLSVILLVLLIPIGGAANIYNTFWLIFIFVLTILQGVSFYFYFFKKNNIKNEG